MIALPSIRKELSQQELLPIIDTRTLVETLRKANNAKDKTIEQFSKELAETRSRIKAYDAAYLEMTNELKSKDDEFISLMKSYSDLTDENKHLRRLLPDEFSLHHGTMDDGSGTGAATLQSEKHYTLSPVFNEESYDLYNTIEDEYIRTAEESKVPDASHSAPKPAPKHTSKGILISKTPNSACKQSAKSAFKAVLPSINPLKDHVDPILTMEELSLQMQSLEVRFDESKRFILSRLDALEDFNSLNS